MHTLLNGYVYVRSWRGPLCGNFHPAAGANSATRQAQFAVSVDEAMLTVRYGIGGDNVVGVREVGKTVMPLSLQFSPEYIDTLEKLKATDVISLRGRAVPLGEVADVAVRKMPEMVRNENGELTGYVFIDLNKVTPSDYVARAQRFLTEKLKLPVGYAIEWTGTYEYAASAAARLRYIVPLTLVIIFGLLLLTFKSFTDALIIMLSVPFAFVGGVFPQWWLGYSMTTAVIIGYIVLFAVAIQTGIIMIVFIRQALANRADEKTYMHAVIDGSVLRLRPKLMTVGAMVLSLFPIMFSSGAGMEIMKPIAAPTIGGMISSTIYALFLIPFLFAIGDDLRHVTRR